MECMPDFLRNCAYDTLFPLLAHQQLSVRENTIKALSSYLTRTDFTVNIQYKTFIFARLMCFVMLLL